MLIFFQHPSTPCLYWRPRLYWRPCLYFFNQYIHTEQEEIHAGYHACSIDFHQDRANNRDCAYNVSKGTHSVLVLETVLVMETCAYNREYTVNYILCTCMLRQYSYWQVFLNTDSIDSYDLTLPVPIFEGRCLASRQEQSFCGRVAGRRQSGTTLRCSRPARICPR